jgi:hypothetical protein
MHTVNDMVEAIATNWHTDWALLLLYCTQNDQ